MGLRSVVAAGAGRLVAWFLQRVAHRNASQLPGRVALSLDPALLHDLARRLGAGSIVVCGTNGKTTTTNVIASALERAGHSVACNRLGANMAAGIASALLADRSVEWAVLEVDELSTPRVVPQLCPRYLVLLNLFRDQLDRSGEIDHVQDVLVDALTKSPQTTLVVCGDDPLSMGVARRVARAGLRVRFFGIGEDLGMPPDRVPEARFCQDCGAELVYRYRSYAQLGDFSCPRCDFARPLLDLSARRVKVEREGVSFDASGPMLPDEVHVSTGLGGTYMVYNLLAALAASVLAGVDSKTFQAALDAYRPENGRLQRFDVAGREVVLNLAKNPTGFNQNISLLLADARQKAVYLAVNDDFNDGRDISWIWDVDFERLASTGAILIAGGRRAGDVQVRLKYAGIEAHVAQDMSDALSLVADLPVEWPLYALTNYSALWPAKATLEKVGERR